MTEFDRRAKAAAVDADLGELEAAAERAAAARSQPSRPPVHLWNPPDCGQIPIQIRRDGSWWHEGALIERTRLVALFASILRREGDRYYLVTPVEKWQVIVEDAPFLAVGLQASGSGRDQVLEFRTQFDDLVAADSDHPIRIVTNAQTGEPSPYVMVRDGLEARMTRAVFYELVDIGVEDTSEGEIQLGVWSSGQFFALGRLEEGSADD